MWLITLLAPLLQAQAADAVSIETKVWREPTFLVVRFYAEGGILDRSTAYKTPVFKTVKAGSKKLTQRFGDTNFPESIPERERKIRVSTQVTLPKDGIEKLDLIEGHIPILAGGDLHETKIEGFRKFKKPKKLKIPTLEDGGAGLTVWFSKRDAIVVRVGEGSARVKELTTKGPFIKSFGTSPNEPYLALFPEKKRLPKGLVLVVQKKDGTEIAIKKLKVKKKLSTIEDDELTKAGIILTIAYEPREILHLMTHGDDRCIRTLELETTAGILQGGEHARTVPGLVDSENQWIYSKIPENAFLKLVVRSGAEWTEVPFSLKNVSIGK